MLNDGLHAASAAFEGDMKAQASSVASTYASSANHDIKALRPANVVTTGVA
jgi:hypothetical protein